MIIVITFLVLFTYLFCLEWVYTGTHLGSWNKGHRKVGNKKYLSTSELAIATIVAIVIPVLGPWMLCAWTGMRKHQALAAAATGVK